MVIKNESMDAVSYVAVHERGTGMQACTEMAMHGCTLFTRAQGIETHLHFAQELQVN